MEIILALAKEKVSEFLAESRITGIYPRSETLIEATRRYDKKLPELFSKEKKKIIVHQAKSGITHVSDPLLDWDDMLRPFTENLGGVERGPLNRFYENNTFYRQPIIKGELSRKGPITKDRIALNLFPKGKKWKVDLPDPYTFADLSDNRFYKKKEDIVFAFAEVLAEEVDWLAKQGITSFQLNAPSLALVEDANMIKQAGEAISVALKKASETAVHFYFGDVSRNIDRFLDYKVDMIGIDFHSTKLEKLNGTRFTKRLGCGYVNAQNTKMETPKEIADFVIKASDTLSPRSIAVMPNLDFEYIPQLFADRKVSNIGKACKILEAEKI
jgi:5-methyltetrahydropteroyltriglutamate--homocysteine methyltransferase